jgi:hypothetical protein
VVSVVICAADVDTGGVDLAEVEIVEVENAEVDDVEAVLYWVKSVVEASYAGGWIVTE